MRRGDDPGPPDLRLAGFQLWVHGPETVCPERDFLRNSPLAEALAAGELESDRWPDFGRGIVL